VRFGDCPVMVGAVGSVGMALADAMVGRVRAPISRRDQRRKNVGFFGNTSFRKSEEKAKREECT
jgi:hypothetical protein